MGRNSGRTDSRTESCRGPTAGGPTNIESVPTYPEDLQNNEGVGLYYGPEPDTLQEGSSVVNNRVGVVGGIWRGGRSGIR